MSRPRWWIAGPRPPLPASVPEHVRRRVRELPADAVIVTGWAEGVDREAEREARRLGRDTDSWRVVEVIEGILPGGRRGHAFAIRRVRREGGCETVDLLPQRWKFVHGDRESRRKAFGRAAWWRNEQMDRTCTDAEMWWDGRSKGTGNAKALASASGKLRALHLFARMR